MSFFTSESGTPVLIGGLFALIAVGVGGGALLQGRFKATSSRAEVSKDVAMEEKAKESTLNQIAILRQDWEKGQGLIATHNEWKQVGESLRKARPKAEALARQRQGLADDVVRLRAEFEDYRGRYCRQIRGAAAGEKLAELSTRQGKIFRDVTIRRVTEAGLEITHADGLASLAASELADSWRERFQW
ncbi:hypothetical protein OKA04_06205 [Luteolibacter flavescens]|uniref:Uncharacterized protein n=1 Tax=Luteolibacter flavescens TaxID=1859460 RepID=A0ABT3FM36_9BACT|nr:hypothetical protein [Luteolibacter flavescens]MCW1884316.1 hypothetical protein [Luteolibacter flavescens]